MRQALEAMNLTKEKINGIIKEITCANGINQKIHLKEGESATSPTVSLEALVTMLVIDAYEGKNYLLLMFLEHI